MHSWPSLFEDVVLWWCCIKKWCCI